MLDNDKPTLSDFNAEATVGYFGFLPKTPIEDQAIRLLYRCMNDQFSGERDDAIEHAELVGNVTIGKIKFRYELYKLHGDFFFPKGYSVDHEALSIAVICDEYTGHINEEIGEPELPEGWEPDNDNRRHDGFPDPETVERAYTLWDQATDLEGGGVKKDAPALSPETVFLAHLNVMQAIREVEETFDDYTVEQLNDILAHDFPMARSFMLPSTSLGEALQDYMGQMEGRIRSAIIPGYKLPNRGLKVIPAESPALQ